MPDLGVATVRLLIDQYRHQKLPHQDSGDGADQHHHDQFESVYRTRSRHRPPPLRLIVRPREGPCEDRAASPGCRRPIASPILFVSPWICEPHMIIGIGTDLVDIARVQTLLDRKGDRARSRLFTPAEIEYCHGANRSAQSFAARFAAKEAFFKAIGIGWGQGVAWTDVEVVSGPNRAPTLRVSAAVEQRLQALGVRRMHLSLTHSETTAAAFLILEG